MTTKDLSRTEKKEVEQTTRECRCYTPDVDIFENREEIVMLVDMPGVAKNDINIGLENDLLSIEGKVDTSRYEGLSPLYSEYNVGHFFRRFTLSDEIDREKIRASMEEGTLTLLLPKTTGAKPKQITVR